MARTNLCSSVISANEPPSRVPRQGRSYHRLERRGSGRAQRGLTEGEASDWGETRAVVSRRRARSIMTARAPPRHRFEALMTSPAGQRLDELDTPQLLLDLDVLDANLAFLQGACERTGKALRVHFKSLKCGSLAKYLMARGVR